MVLQVNTREHTFDRVTQKQFNTDQLNLLTIAATEQQAHLASAGHSTLKGLDLDIDPDRAPKNFKDAMSLKDRQEWAEALNKEYRGFKDSNALAIVKPPKVARILGTLTRWEYEKDNGRLLKYKVCMVVRGDQQVEGESFTSSYLYAPVLKAPEARLLLAIAAAEGCSVYKTDTSQAFLYSSMGDDVVYIEASDWPDMGTLAHIRKATAFNSSRALWNPTGSPQMTHSYLGLDGKERLPRSQQREDYLHEAQGCAFYYPQPVCGRHDARNNQYQAPGRVSEEVFKGFQHHWRRPHEDALGYGGRTGQQDDQAPS
jgi:hypothetical protein